MKKLLMFFTVISSCQREPDAFEINLVGDDKCWLYNSSIDKSKYDNINPSGICTRFSRNGNFTEFTVSNSTIEEAFAIDEKLTIENSWHFIPKDSLLVVGNTKFKIISFSRDTIKLRNSKNIPQMLIRYNTQRQ
ncbi:hypothetical protein [Hymenobacter lucidus]|uniref:Lipocalin-like domain-containing protein n=1 Tax=Hymenobacter lucidus TaxID=2880930 RepID=A0ABS8AZD5_9BACT|nr:hypothetical protein [Hymenobacter lucidus]MCB2411150.1 hypothetical protein [Hymenobacter lucidus]